MCIGGWPRAASSRFVVALRTTACRCRVCPGAGYDGLALLRQAGAADNGVARLILSRRCRVFPGAGDDGLALLICPGAAPAGWRCRHRRGAAYFVPTLLRQAGAAYCGLALPTLAQRCLFVLALLTTAWRCFFYPSAAPTPWRCRRRPGLASLSWRWRHWRGGAEIWLPQARQPAVCGASPSASRGGASDRKRSRSRSAENSSGW